MEEEEEATQLATQPLPGHEGEPPSNADSDFLNGVICLLHPASFEACKAVERLSRHAPIHVLKVPPEVKGETDGNKTVSEAGGEPASNPSVFRQSVYHGDGLDIALRLKPGPKDPDMGFMFGRNPNRCDIVIGEGEGARRVSNSHFRIFQNPKGVLMLEDFSTNGTWVNEVRIGGKGTRGEAVVNENGNTHALFAGTIIVVAPGNNDVLRFVVRIPSRSGSRLDSEVRSPGIDPGPAPLPATPRVPRLRDNLGAPPPTRNTQGLAAFRRPPLKPEEMHSSVSTRVDPGWDGAGIYKMMEIIGTGAFATVKRAVVKKTGDVFAVKMIQKRTFAGQANGGKGMGMRKEVEILQRLNHPNIVSCSACFEDTAYIYIVMEYVGGGDLSEYLKRNEYMREDMVQEVSRQLLKGIKYVHSMRISHRDLKPDNILIVSEDPLMVKISDFGLAKMIQSEETFLKTFCGTMLYLAPEVYPAYATAMVVGGGSVKRKRHPKEEAGREDALGAKVRQRYSEAVDMWSLGCVIHMLLTGKSAFEGKNQDQMLKTILKGFRNIAHLERVLGRECDVVKDFLGRLLQVDPIHRMMEVEALNHEWLKLESDRSSSSMDEDLDDEICHEGDDGYAMVREEREEWTKMPSSIPGKWVDSVEADDDGSDGKSPPPKPEDDALSGAVRKMSFQPVRSLGNGLNNNSLGDDSFISIDNADAESQVCSRMFRAPPDIPNKRFSSEVPEDNASIYVVASVGLPDSGASASEAMPAMYDKRVDFASQVVPGSEVRAMDDSVTGTAALVDMLRHEQQSNEESQAFSEKIPTEGASNNSSFDDPAVIYSTPYSLLKTPESPQHASQNTVNSENHLPLSQPCNILPSSQPYDVRLEPRNFIRPNPPWGKLVPIEGSAPYKTIYLNRPATTIGRASDCTYTILDLRVSKMHLCLMLAYPEMTNQPPDHNNWRPQSHMIAWIKVWASNGCRLNGKKKRQNRAARVYNGDIIHIYSDKGEFLAFKCEFAIGNHKRYAPEESDEDLGRKLKPKPKERTERESSLRLSMATTVPIESSFEKEAGGSNEGSSEVSSDDGL